MSIAKYNWARDYDWQAVASELQKFFNDYEESEASYSVSMTPDPVSNTVSVTVNWNPPLSKYCIAGWYNLRCTLEPPVYFVMGDSEWTDLEYYGHSPASIPVISWDPDTGSGKGIVYYITNIVLQRYMNPREQERLKQSVAAWQAATAEAYPSNTSLPTTPDPRYQTAVSTSTATQTTQSQQGWVLSAKIDAPGGFEVGKSWTITVTGPPDQDVTIAASQNGIPLGETRYGSTDSSGRFYLQGTFTDETVGTWYEEVKVGGEVAGRFSFQIAPRKAPTGTSPQPGNVSVVDAYRQYCEDHPGECDKQLKTGVPSVPGGSTDWTSIALIAGAGLVAIMLLGRGDGK